MRFFDLFRRSKRHHSSSASDHNRVHSSVQKVRQTEQKNKCEISGKTEAEPETVLGVRRAAEEAHPGDSGPRTTMLSSPIASHTQQDLATQAVTSAVFESLRAAAQDGSAPAQHLLALQYLNGIGVPLSMMLAEHWLTKAAAAGDTPAQFTLAMLHWEGQTLPKGIWQTKHWLEKSADAGHPRAKLMLAKLEGELPSPPANDRSRTQQPIPPNVARRRPSKYAKFFEHIDKSIGKTRSGKPFDFAVIGERTTDENEPFFQLGYEAGTQCRKVAEQMLVRVGRTLSAQDHDAHFDLITAAETIAQRRRFTEAGVDAGMEELVDGSDALFDERRAAFIKGVTEAIRAGENN
jgi:hypothetical protein